MHHTSTVLGGVLREGHAQPDKPVAAQGVVQAGEGVAASAGLTDNGRLLVKQVADANPQAGILGDLPDRRKVEIVAVIDRNRAVRVGVGAGADVAPQQTRL